MVVVVVVVVVVRPGRQKDKLLNIFITSVKKDSILVIRFFNLQENKGKQRCNYINRKKSKLV